MSASSLSLEKLEKICSKNPTSILFARLAEGFLKQGQVKRAAEICRQGLRYRPSYVAGHVVMGKCHLAGGFFEEARQEFQKVLQLDADHPAALWYLGQIDLKLGWEDLALRHFELALILDPLNASLIAQIEKLKPKAAPPEIPETTHPEAFTEDDVVVEDVVPLDTVTGEEDGATEDVANETDAASDRVELVVDENLSTLVSELAQGHVEPSPDAPVEDEAEKSENQPFIATVTLAELYAQQGLVEQAVATLEHVLERDPNNATVLARLEELRS